jgi:hypothetical protein
MLDLPRLFRMGVLLAWRLVELQLLLLRVPRLELQLLLLQVPCCVMCLMHNIGYDNGEKLYTNFHHGKQYHQ